MSRAPVLPGPKLRPDIPVMAPNIVTDPGSSGRLGRRRRGIARNL